MFSLTTSVISPLPSLGAAFLVSFTTKHSLLSFQVISGDPILYYSYLKKVLGEATRKIHSLPHTHSSFTFSVSLGHRKTTRWPRLTLSSATALLLSSQNPSHQPETGAFIINGWDAFQLAAECRTDASVAKNAGPRLTHAPAPLPRSPQQIRDAYLQSCILKMEKDIEHWPKPHPQTSACAVQAYNTLACQMEGIFSILKEDPADAEHQILTRFLCIANKSSRFTVGLCLNLVNACKEASTKIEMISILQQRQQETTSITERFITFQDKGKGAGTIPGRGLWKHGARQADGPLSQKVSSNAL